MFNQLPHILSITLQVASSNFNIVLNSKTIVIKEKKIPRLEFSKSFEVSKNNQRLVKTQVGFKFSNSISLKKKKKTSDGITRLQSWRNLTYQWLKKWMISFSFIKFLRDQATN